MECDRYSVPMNFNGWTTKNATKLYVGLDVQTYNCCGRNPHGKLSTQLLGCDHYGRSGLIIE